jgi:hypothetical protein
MPDGRVALNNHLNPGDAKYQKMALRNGLLNDLDYVRASA